MRITDWSVAERPREKLLVHGADKLSDAELLAIILNTGVAGQTSLGLAEALLHRFGDIAGLFVANDNELRQVSGIGNAKIALLRAARALASRSVQERLVNRTTFNDVTAVSDFLLLEMAHLKQEVFAVLTLNSQHQLLHFRKMFFGSISSAAVYPRELVRQALADNAAAVILAHNHPSGVAEPSQADRDITQRIIAALDLIEVSVLDHFVVGRTSTVSFAQRGLI
ncbi:RadC family protein [Alteromonas flava]|uniref:RadC family protein n=1 Tax=Alteromonas flava TaxID=2048003 RepID=UPI000C28666B|nr:DNA repair protein RadC [Alteromonas flava]